jgi:RNA polymerase sigma factor (sigma-70 family)
MGWKYRRWEVLRKNGFKFDILTQRMVKKEEDMPSHFLAETAEEAKDIYKRFERTLNNMAYAYAVSTGLDKSDLFGEALIGLARAYRDWDPDRSEDFRTYAIFRIKDSLNEFVRANSRAVSIPAYIKKALSNLNEIRAICEASEVNPDAIIVDNEVPLPLERTDALRCVDLVRNLIKAAKRARVPYNKFIERLELIPTDTEFEDQTSPELHKREEEMLEAAIIVEKLKSHMDDVELQICEGIMSDKSFEEIGKEMGKSKSWVSGRLKGLRERILFMMKEGSL